MRFVLATTEPHKMPATIVGRCQRFDFRRLTIDGLCGACCGRSPGPRACSSTRAPRFAMARQAEGSARDALSLLDQATRGRGASASTRTVVRSLLGVPQGEIRRRDRRRGRGGRPPWRVRGGRPARPGGSRPSQRHRAICSRTSATCCSCRPRPTRRTCSTSRPTPTRRCGPRPTSSRRRSSRACSTLLLAAQTDMRWTTSPRLTLELALVRACAPETDPTPAGVVARLERLERLANVAAGRRRRPRRTPSRSRCAEPRTRSRDRASKKAADEAGDGLGRRAEVPAADPVAEARSPRRGHPAPGSPRRRRCERRRRDAPPVLGIADPAPRPAQPAGAARADGERHADRVRRHDARARVPADVQEHGQAGREPRRQRFPERPAGAVRHLPGDHLRRARVPRRRRRDARRAGRGRRRARRRRRGAAPGAGDARRPAGDRRRREA